MKKNTFTLFASCLLTLFAFQAQAQYEGVPFGGEAPQVGVDVGTPVKIELENYDALASEPNGDGANYGLQSSDLPPDLPAAGTYFDKSPGGSADGNPIRTGSDVDIEAGATGAVLAGNQGQEFALYTVNVVQAGTYHMGVNYLHGGNSKDIRLSYFNADGTGPRVDLHDTLEDEGLPSTDGEYITTDDLGSFELPAGTIVLRFLHLDAGPRFDFFTLTLDEISATSTDDLANANTIKAFPNPTGNGVFTVNIEGEWSVYSLLGGKVLEGAGNRVDLSTFPTGVYYLRTPNASVKLVSE